MKLDSKSTNKDGHTLAEVFERQGTVPVQFRETYAALIVKRDGYFAERKTAPKIGDTVESARAMGMWFGLHNARHARQWGYLPANTQTLIGRLILAPAALSEAAQATYDEVFDYLTGIKTATEAASE